MSSSRWVPPLHCWARLLHWETGEPSLSTTWRNRTPSAWRTPWTCWSAGNLTRVSRSSNIHSSSLACLNKPHKHEGVNENRLLWQTWCDVVLVGFRPEICKCSVELLSALLLQVTCCVPYCTPSVTWLVTGCTWAKSTRWCTTTTLTGLSRCCCWSRYPGTCASTSTRSPSPVKERTTNPVSHCSRSSICSSAVTLRWLFIHPSPAHASVSLRLHPLPAVQGPREAPPVGDADSASSHFRHRGYRAVREGASQMDRVHSWSQPRLLRRVCICTFLLFTRKNTCKVCLNWKLVQKIESIALFFRFLSFKIIVS